jgi:hypothetical protein
MSAELARLETRLKESIVAETDPEDLLRPARPGGAPRIGIYRDAYRLRLAEALASNFPILEATLGDEGFEALAYGYIAAHPSQSPSIRWFGEHLVDWLVAHPDAVGHPALIDLARMEWALGVTFDGPDKAALTVAELVRIDPSQWPQLRFTAHPCTRMVRLEWGIEPLWKALSADRDAQTDPPEAVNHRLLVWRDGYETQWRSVEAAEAELIEACLSGESFESLCIRASAREPEGAAERVAGLLRRWVEAGVFCAVRFPPRAGASH